MSRRRRPTGQSSKAPRPSTRSGRAPDRRSSGAGARHDGRREAPAADFWGRADDEAPAPAVRPTPDPAALPRSLGDPPLGSNPLAVQHHLGAVYEEAVRAAIALAAANGLLETDDGTPGGAAAADG